jgi:hypothetical protein
MPPPTYSKSLANPSVPGASDGAMMSTVCGWLQRLGANLVPAPDLALTPIGFSVSVRREFSNPFWNSLLSNFVYLSKVA